MKMTTETLCRRLPAAALLLLAAQATASAQNGGSDATAPAADTPARRHESAVKRVSEAVAVVHTMNNERGMSGLLDRMRGVYIVPKYGRAALGVGASGGPGVLMLRRADGSWGNPVFYNIGGISIGLQAGAEGGPLALLLMNQKAVDSFRNKNNFSLSADAGLTVINFARMARGSTGGDVVAWSGNKGLFGNVATVGVSDIRYNAPLTEAYYGKPLTALQAIDNTELNPQADALRQVLGNAATPAGSGAR
jgi:lipid-binding SYLF domain-containing protein